MPDVSIDWIPLPSQEVVDALPRAGLSDLRIGDLICHRFETVTLHTYRVTNISRNELWGVGIGARAVNVGILLERWPHSGAQPDWPLTSYKLVFRPADGVRVTESSAGLALFQPWGAAPSAEFAQQLADGFTRDPPTASMQLAEFVSGMTNSPLDRKFMSIWANDAISPLHRACAILSCVYSYSGNNPALCTVCADRGVFRTVEALEGFPPCFTHYTCTSCKTRHAHSCTECTKLYVVNCVYCETCCPHATCTHGEGHLTRKTSLHQHCGKCETHCRCSKCEQVDECAGAISCQSCFGCAPHCVCKPERKMLNINERQAVFRPSKRYHRGLRRLLGTELEVHNVTQKQRELNAVLRKWSCSVVRDGSIAGRGMELVTSPAGGENWVAQSKEIGEALVAANAQAHASCGQHVHVDARDLGVYDLARVIRLYAAVEDALFDAQPARRRLSNYCVPCGASYLNWLSGENKKLTKHWLAAKQYGLAPVKNEKDKEKQKANTLKFRQQLRDRAHRKYDDTRYRALNLHSFWHRGTIEFRHGGAAVTPEHILHWGIVCGSVVEFAATHGDADVLKVCGMKPHDALLQVIFEKETRDWLQSRWEKFGTATVPADEDEEVEEVEEE